MKLTHIIYYKRINSHVNMRLVLLLYMCVQPNLEANSLLQQVPPTHNVTPIKFFFPFLLNCLFATKINGKSFTSNSSNYTNSASPLFSDCFEWKIVETWHREPHHIFMDLPSISQTTSRMTKYWWIAISMIILASFFFMHNLVVYF